MTNIRSHNISIEHIQKIKDERRNASSIKKRMLDFYVWKFTF